LGIFDILPLPLKGIDQGRVQRIFACSNPQKVENVFVAAQKWSSTGTSKVRVASILDCYLNWFNIKNYDENEAQHSDASKSLFS
jgi:hypothetical protein